MAGFKIGCPLIIDTFCAVGLPLYITCDCTAFNLTVIENGHQDDTVEEAVNMLCGYIDKQYHAYLYSSHITISQEIAINASYKDSYIIAGLLYIVYEYDKNFVNAYDIFEIVDHMCEDTTNLNNGIIKSLLRGGVYLSGKGFHERILLGEGLFINASNNSEINYAPTKKLNREESSLMVTYLLKGQIEKFIDVFDSFLRRHQTDKLWDTSLNKSISFSEIGQITRDIIDQSAWTTKVNNEGIYKY